jgi:hypothetical protein
MTGSCSLEDPTYRSFRTVTCYPDCAIGIVIGDMLNFLEVLILINKPLQTNFELTLCVFPHPYNE